MKDTKELKKIEKSDVMQYLNDFRGISYFNKKIIFLNNYLDDISTQLIGVSSAVTDKCYIENKKPYSHSRLMELIDKEEKLIAEREKYVNRILELESVFNELDEEIQQYMITLYILKNNHDKVAKEYDFTRQALYKRINKAIIKALKVKRVTP